MANADKPRREKKKKKKARAPRPHAGAKRGSAVKQQGGAEPAEQASAATTSGE